MPQSLLISTPPQGSATKRQRSAERNPARSRANSSNQNGSVASTLVADKIPSKTGLKMPPYLEKSKNEILATFQELEWKQRFRLFHAMENPDTSPYRVDRSRVVVARNRYGNVQPWDASRIKLKAPISGSDYVNASPIVLRSRGKRPSNLDELSTMETRYIATQGPKEGQNSHFWYMVHQEVTGDTGVVIMLTQLMEDNREKCAQYYPADLETPVMTLLHEEQIPNLSQGTGNGDDPFLDRFKSTGTDFAKVDEDGNPQPAPEPQNDRTPNAELTDTVTLLSKEFDDSVGCEVRKLRLSINSQPKTIYHYLFGRWPDFGKPSMDDRKALIELSRRTFTEAQGSPRIVHCSAGVGRTGTWIALDFLVREVEAERLLDDPGSTENPLDQTLVKDVPDAAAAGTWGKSGPPKVYTPTHEDGFDREENDLIYDTVNTLREQRMMMVIREVQYSFLYDVVREAVLEKYRARAEGATVTANAHLDAQPRRNKVPRLSGDTTATESNSDAETEIMDIEAQTVVDDDDDHDPYSAVSPDVLRRGLSQES